MYRLNINTGCREQDGCQHRCDWEIKVPAAAINCSTSSDVRYSLVRTSEFFLRRGNFPVFDVWHSETTLSATLAITESLLLNFPVNGCFRECCYTGFQEECNL